MRCTIICCCLVILIQGCTALRPYPAASLTNEDAMCLRWLENIEGSLEKYGIYDPEATRINGFPHLRVNRFLASMSDRTTSMDTFAEWLEQMRQLGSTGIKFEFANLPAYARQELVTKTPTGGAFGQTLERCGKRLNKLSLKSSEHKKILLEQAQIPDAYQSWKRVIGLYPIARYIAAISIERLHRQLNNSFEVPLEKLPALGKLIRYSPMPQINPIPTESIAEILSASKLNPLGIPRLTSLQLQQFLAHFAPVWEIDTRNDTDKIGKISLDSNDQQNVNVNQPTVYAKQSYTRWHGKVLLQLIYQIWLPAREKTGLLDLYGGSLDSVIWRVTLSPEGTPIAFDSIHACGCYYLLFPGKGYRAITPKDRAEPVLSPKAIATSLPGQHLLLRLQSRTHYLQQVSLVEDVSDTATHSYTFQDLEQLRSLPLPNGAYQSLYGDDGIIDASARIERFVLWPYGIASPGAMRQWGTQAIAFIGRRHFDDPFLLENLVGKE